ncbi:Actin- protein 2/3 complex subunit 5, partial [Coelomomyces lativittatus]
IFPEPYKSILINPISIFIYICRGNVSGALLKALDSPPYSQSEDWTTLKEKNGKYVISVLLAAKLNEIPSLIANLNESQLGLLMKYIFKGMEISTSSSNCSTILAWFDKLVDLIGVGGIIRVLADPRTV